MLWPAEADGFEGVAIKIVTPPVGGGGGGGKDPVVSLAPAQSAWSYAAPSPPSVTMRRSSFFPATLTLTALVAEEPVITPLSNNFSPSAQTWNTTDPFGLHSSSTPTSERKVEYCPPRLKRSSE